MKKIVVLLPVGKYSRAKAKKYADNNFKSVDDFLNEIGGLKGDVNWYEMEEFMREANNDSIDLENFYLTYINVPDNFYTDLNELLNYVEQEEGKHYEEMQLQGDDTDGHIYEAICRIRKHVPEFNKVEQKTELTYDAWIEKYKPIKNSFDNNASLDGCMYETYGKELTFVKNICSTEIRFVWTVIHGDGSEGSPELFILNGYHLCNRAGYLITEEQCEQEYLEVTIS